MLLIEWWNFCDKDDVYFSNGFRHKFIVEPYESTPVMDVNENVIINGLNEEKVKFARIAERCVFEAIGIPNASLYALSQIRYHSNIQITDTETGTIIEPKNFQFEYRPQSNGCLSIGVFSFETASSIIQECC